MSSRRGLSMRWHARCLSYWQKGGTPRLEGSHASGFENKIAEARRRPYSPATELRIATGITTTNDDDTPPQNKQATNPVSHNTGFFFGETKSRSLSAQPMRHDGTTPRLETLERSCPNKTRQPGGCLESAQLAARRGTRRGARVTRRRLPAFEGRPGGPNPLAR
jgi:hypothetical protein